MLRTYEGYWNGECVLPLDFPITITKNSKVHITVLDEQVQEIEKALTVEEKLAAMAVIDRMAAESAAENHLLDEFEPARTNRQLIDFSEG
jgi:ABC-type Na+ transport system ATPase subunit NatA